MEQYGISIGNFLFNDLSTMRKGKHFNYRKPVLALYLRKGPSSTGLSIMVRHFCYKGQT
jgi:hypothetical protein